jgi:hypothetical protein
MGLDFDGESWHTRSLSPVVGLWGGLNLGIRTGHLDGDGLVDVIVVDPGPIQADPPRSPAILFGAADDGGPALSFQEEPFLNPLPSRIWTCLVADIDGDDDEDLLLLAAPNGVTSVAVNDGAGRFDVRMAETVDGELLGDADCGVVLGASDEGGAVVFVASWRHPYIGRVFIR